MMTNFPLTIRSLMFLFIGSTYYRSQIENADHCRNATALICEILFKNSFEFLTKRKEMSTYLLMDYQQIKISTSREEKLRIFDLSRRLRVAKDENFDLEFSISRWENSLKKRCVFLDETNLCLIEKYFKRFY